MSFIQIAYCTTVPLFLLVSLFPQYRHSFINLMVVSNLLLVGNSIFLVRQFIELYQIAKYFHFTLAEMRDDVPVTDMIHVALIILLPFFSLLGWVKKNRHFSVFLLVLLYWGYPVHTWNTYDLFSKIPGYFCLLCSGYALLWLLNKLPYQSPVK
jgi:hypothetical protein